MLAFFIADKNRMLYDILNPTRATRVIYPRGDASELRILPGEMARGVEIMPQVLEMLLGRIDDLTVRESDGGPQIINAMLPDKPLVITGMYGIGDNIHQRAALRELMKSHEVWLRSCHVSLYHDLIEQGLKVLFMPTKLRAQARTILRERHLFSTETPPRNAHAYRVWYHKPEIDRYGSILGAMMAAFRLPGLKEPDFSLPVRPEWTQAARQMIAVWKPSKPILIYRPILLRKEWDGSSRNPETRAYDLIFREIRDKFFVVSIADLETDKEWIAGYPVKADIELHRGELDFPTMAALFKEAQLVFSPAGFGPILAQSVGTPSIVVYGGRESFRTTDSAGVHLAPTLGINPIQPCDCHSHRHACKKKIDVSAAQLMVKDFVFRWCGVADHARPSPAAASASAPAETKTEITASVRSRPVLLFGTTYIDSPERMRLLEQWVEMHQATGGDICELLIVDSASPCLTAPGRVKVERFPDNIGHLAKGGNDGWGRAFCRGLELAIEGGFEYAVHVEGDSLFRLPIAPIIEDMRRRRAKVASAIVRGMRKDYPHWVETGLMVFEVEYLKHSGFIHRYDWPSRRAHPVPEAVVYGLVAPELSIMPWRVWRDDRHQITSQNVERFNLDWLSHCDPSKGAYERFLQAYRPKADAPATALPETQTAVSEAPGGLPKAGPLRLNFGCGTNRLAGWHNMDAEVDISKPLPFADGAASRVLAEHVVEHITYYEALAFFKEVRRVLKPGGAFRVCVPSIEQIGQCGNVDYFRFTQKWQKLGETAVGAMHAILYGHGHKTAWTASLLHWSLVYAGFEAIQQARPGESEITDLVGVEGHGKVIGDSFNLIESCVFEAINGPPITTASLQAIEEAADAKVAIVLGGASGVEKEFEEAKAICREAGVGYTVIAANDQIVHCEEPITAVTLHPDKLSGWLGERRSRGYPTPFQIWCHRNAVHVTHTTRDWSGSSGLLGVQVAWKKLGKSRVILAGVPMSVEAGHFLRNRSWHACKAFLAAWQKRRTELTGTVRSMSGWTRETFGAPDGEWLKS